MGAKTALLAYMDAEGPSALRPTVAADRERTEALVRRLYPGWEIADAAACELGEATYPPEGTAYVGSFPGMDIVCDRHWMGDFPTRLAQYLIDASAGRRMVVHWMHSVVDFFAFAVWEDGRLVRSLSLSPDNGIVEDIGERFPFEAPYWAGEHPVKRIPGWPVQGPYPLPFHPLELGEEALRTFFGFVLEGRPVPADIDASAVELRGFRLKDPQGPDPVVRQAAIAAAVARMGPPRRFGFAPDGSMVEIDSR
ncbi:hypothetical protein ACEZCY_16025 [Streptacidiphilus sp. N1-12]|uniref:SnoaL-like domain-containing protein n=2 Tax=Streptacidiphilus alkalitolerans TaxID=3342712 RepID=A0ABV6WFE7_9ACTN